MLNDKGIEGLNHGIAKYVEIAENESVESLNNIDVNNIKFKSSGCFIATAVYGSPLANEVIILKTFRDNFLLKLTLGRFFVKFYYWISPTIAKTISKNNYLKNVTRRILIVPLIRTLVNHKKEY